MKLLSNVFGWLFAIGKDRYMHIVVGSLIASLSLIVFCWLPMWANMLISVIVVSAAALIKDYAIDITPDWVDIVCTSVGGLMVWLPVIILCL